VCSFVPRLFDYHPLAIPAPYNHANVDSDELLFYVDGDFMSRKGSGVGAGSISLHPAGFVHGPQPGSVEASIGATATEEVAVMIDTFARCDWARPPSPVRTRSAWSWQHGLEAGRGTTFRGIRPSGGRRPAGAAQADGCDGSGGGGTGSGSSGMAAGAGGWPGSGSVGGTGDGG
jgi:hypothetical protein